ncbi:Endochitinase [Colletotrichum orbiculare MAFF 240422]|uniref:chitinase n=1 Tax=Colletotrichum orbiculare (strain 104-T / ATCC 96160 / CBS 514.97 / LARS 414 / MAFF 240422) TaxID=1213857 RepID=N4VEM7_COLOR|nr:Endochitinase [Colletotrichum orbiculare MAFF 240422]
MAGLNTLFRQFPSFTFIIIFLSLFSVFSSAFPTGSRDGPSKAELATTTCRNEAYHPFDYSVKPAQDRNLPLCPTSVELAAIQTRDLLLGRQVTQEQDYSCNEFRPCGNGACCAKTGWCNYGPEACGTNGQSPNDKCWSNCDAKAECGRYAETKGKECPLNVCCSPFGFCGMTEDFCKKTDDEETSCQSNCDQPGSGSSNGNVRKRVVGYYEAWVHSRACNGMSIDQMPVGALTHLMFSFAYVSPNDFQIVPMDDLEPNLFSKMTAMKKQNRALKVMVALGGWTFNDPGATQLVFHDVASSKANRSKFIGNLLSFMRQYGFDGVDFDWEYPGADDRGGAEEDGKNFTLLLEELKAAIKNQPLEYVVSFTTPTSFWYLRHFDLKASTDAVDFVNIMSYDLHGVWDAWNPIGSNVLAHSNLTEIKLALDLYWRNDIPPEKLNLGIGFYGRSFELTDPACNKPGCQFRGGAAPGPCTANSGTLAYREIEDIIKKHNLKPYYDKEHQIKYIVWNQNQWVSYDDPETIEAKIDFANEQGLGGLLIWSIDQDTDNLDALGAVVGPTTKALALRQTLSEDGAATWDQLGAQNCYVTGCGGKCDKAGFKAVTTQPCGDATFFTRHSSEDDSTLCCPVSSAPDPKDCKWRSQGDAPTCNGRCEFGEVGLQMNKWGDGKYCEDGHKMYCCKTKAENSDGDKCRFHDNGKKCPSGQKALTFSGGFGNGNIGEKTPDVDLKHLQSLTGTALEDALDEYTWKKISLWCCDDDEFKKWKNCEWKGKPGSCFDAHCDLNTEVMLTWAGAGGGEMCFPHPDPHRARIFCCDPPSGSSLFLPAALKDLFPDPPTGDDVKTKGNTKTDDTWGGSRTGGSDDDPNKSAIQFYVMASPTEIQVTLDKRDGSHWELFNCDDAHSLGAQTVQMVCMNDSEDSNCKELFLGNGAPGTIIEMPQDQGCGPGKYAVVESLEVSHNQTLPGHVTRRTENPPVIYDLKFGYNFKLVPREYGDTQLRIDYSNQEGYWDHIVTRPVSKKRKRSLEEFGGNHKRWLEEEWRDDNHFGGLSKKDLHKRWFGDDVLEWLESLVEVEIVKTEKRHVYEEDLSAVLLRDEWDCGEFKGKIDAVATAGIKMATSFGFALITTLNSETGLDLSKSYLHFANKGSVNAVFTLDARMTLHWDSEAFNIAPIYFQGASFVVPGFGSLGPRLDLRGEIKADITVEGRVEARVNIVDWDIQQTYPQHDTKFDPKELSEAKRGIDRRDLAEPTFDAEMKGNGDVEFHLMPTMVFGLEFDDVWSIATTDVELVADTWIRMRVDSDLDCGFGYGVDAGMSLVAQAQIPDIFKWTPQTHTFKQIEKNLIPGNGKEWQCASGATERRMIDSGFNATEITAMEPFSLSPPSLQKRIIPYESDTKPNSKEKTCPPKGGAEEQKACNEITAVDGFYEGEDDGSWGAVAKRSVAIDDDFTANSSANPAHPSGLFDRDLEKRAGKTLSVCAGTALYNVNWLDWSSLNRGNMFIYDSDDWSDCSNMDSGIQQRGEQILKNKKGANEQYVIEHVLEAQTFSRWLSIEGADGRGVRDLCRAMKAGGWMNYAPDPLDANGARVNPITWVVQQAYPSATYFPQEFISVIEPVNWQKQKSFGSGARLQEEASLEKEAQWKEGTPLDQALRTLKITVVTFKYLVDPELSTLYRDQASRVGIALDAMEDHMVAQGTWTKRNLQQSWLSFVKTSAEVAGGKLVKLLDTYISRAEKVLQGTDASKDDDDRKKRRATIQALRTVYDNDIKGKWVNPMP